MKSLPPLTEQVWHELHADLLRFIRSRVADASTADDLLQEVFLRIHDRLDTLADIEQLRAWVYRITRNVITDHFRAQPLAASPTQPVASPQLDEGANLNQEVGGWLAQMVDHLPQTYREAVRFAELEGVSQQEVASRLGLSLSGAKSRIQRGRVLLKETLTQCCHLELDARGNVLEITRRSNCASCCQGTTECP